MSFNSFPPNAPQEPVPDDRGRTVYPYYRADDDEFTYKPSNKDSSIVLHTIIPGYNRDGDTIRLPYNPGTSGLGTDVIYYNAAGTLQWFRTCTGLDGSADEFVGFFFLNDLLYICTVDIGPSPDVYSFFTLSKSNSKGNIGNNNANVWQITGGVNRWTILPDVQGSMQWQYDPTSGDAYLWQNSTTPNWTTVTRISLTTGQLTTGAYNVTNSSSASLISYITPEGIIVLGTTTNSINLASNSGVTGADITGTSNILGGPSITESGIDINLKSTKLVSYTQEDEGIALLIPTLSNNSGISWTKKFWDRAKFNTAMNDAWKFQGFSV